MHPYLVIRVDGPWECYALCVCVCIDKFALCLPVAVSKVSVTFSKLSSRFSSNLFHLYCAYCETRTCDVCHPKNTSLMFMRRLVCKYNRLNDKVLINQLSFLSMCLRSISHDSSKWIIIRPVDGLLTWIRLESEMLRDAEGFPAQCQNWYKTFMLHHPELMISLKYQNQYILSSFQSRGASNFSLQGLIFLHDEKTLMVNGHLYSTFQVF